MSFGLGMIILVFLIEIFGLHPTGIYSYTRTGYKSFDIGMSKSQVLDGINQNRSIRSIRMCDPAGMVRLTDRRGFEMTPQMADSDHWVCYDRRGSDLLFLFKNDCLYRMLILRIRLGREKNSRLFNRCDPLIVQRIDHFLRTQTDFKVFYK